MDGLDEDEDYSIAERINHIPTPLKYPSWSAPLKESSIRLPIVSDKKRGNDDGNQRSRLLEDF